MKSATVPLVMKVLLPLMTYRLPTFTAWVVIPIASEPALGSVIPRQPIYSPLQALGRIAVFCSSEAFRRKLSKQRVWLAPTGMARALLPRPLVLETEGA